jgi:hypothetical protein
VRNRIKDGTYEAEQVVTERGPTYFIKRESILNNLTTSTLTSASQDYGTSAVSPQALAFVQELLRPFVNELGEVREELGAERVRREMAETALREGMAEERRRREEAERERDDLRRELYGLREAPESPESPGPSETPTSAEEPPQAATEPSEARSWWQRWFGSVDR